MSLFFKLNVAGVGNENVAVCFFHISLVQISSSQLSLLKPYVT